MCQFLRFFVLIDTFTGAPSKGYFIDSIGKHPQNMPDREKPTIPLFLTINFDLAINS